MSLKPGSRSYDYEENPFPHFEAGKFFQSRTLDVNSEAIGGDVTTTENVERRRPHKFSNEAESDRQRSLHFPILDESRHDRPRSGLSQGQKNPRLSNQFRQDGEEVKSY